MSAQAVPYRPAFSLREAWRGQVTRRLAAAGHVPDSLAHRPTPRETGSAAEADAMARGHWVLAGRAVKVERGEPWRVPPPSEGWAEALHGFGWLRHLRAAGGPASRSLARKLAQGWLARHGSRGGLAWRAAVTGDRLSAWALSAPLLIENAEPTYRSALLRAMGVQARFLKRTAATESRPARRLRAATGLIHAGLCLAGQDAALREGLRLFEEAADALSDGAGGVASRAPSDLLDLLERCAQLAADLEDAGRRDEAAPLRERLARGAPVLRALRLGDGGLALMHGGRAGEADRVNRLLVESGSRDAPPGDAMGALRLSAGRLVALMDAGDAPRGRLARTAHAGPLSLEVSIGRRRIFGNVGSGAHLDASWADACRGAAAHATLTLDGGVPGRFAKGRLVDAPRCTERAMEADEDGIWALAAHDGWVASHGLVHYRRLFLSPDGTDLRGEDTLVLAEGGAKVLAKARAARKAPDGPPFAVRFHLPPDVAADVSGKAVLLTLPSGERWRLVQSGGRLALEDSVWLPREAGPKATRQVVVNGMVGDEGACVRWALKRLETEAEARDFAPDAPPPDAEADPDAQPPGT